MLTELIVGALVGGATVKKYSNMTQEEIKEDLSQKASTVCKVASAGASLVADKIFASKEDMNNYKSKNSCEGSTYIDDDGDSVDNKGKRKKKRVS